MKQWKYIIVIFIFPLIVLSLSETKAKEQKMGKKAEKVIVCLGDSLTAGYGLHLEQSYPTLLQKMLNDEGYNYSVINAGISGETSSGTLSRLDWVIGLHPDIVIFEIGANDGLFQHDLDVTKKNLAKTIEALHADNIVVIFAGMRMVWNAEADFVEKFNAIYPDLAQQYDVIFMPFFLEGVAMRNEFNLPDMIHPNAAGYTIIANTIFPYVKKAIKRREAQ